MALQQALANHEAFQNVEVELTLVDEASGPCWIRLSGLPLRDETGRVRGFRGTAIDVSQEMLADALIRDYNETLIHEVAERTAQLEQANDVLSELSNTDGLTGLANRRRFDVFFTHEWARALRNREYIAILLFDIDHFKNVNDALGHVLGDQLLIEVARRLRSHLTECVVLGRIAS